MPGHHIRSYLRAMSETQASFGRPRGAGLCEIRVKGHLAARWGAWFDGLALTHENDGTTLIHGQGVDQSALHGLLQKVRDAGLPLVSVKHVEPDPPEVATANR
jgi:hypothetical protein